MENILLAPDTIKTVEDFKKWLKPNENVWHPLNITVIHKKYNCEAFNFHINQAGFDGNMYYHAQSAGSFLKCKVKSLNRVFKFVYIGTNTGKRPTEKEVAEWEKWQ